MIEVAVFAALAIYFVRYMHYHDRLLYGLPQLTWLTIEDVVSAGHSELVCRSWLPAFHVRKQLTIRPRSETGEYLLANYPLARAFCMRTVQHFEFQIIDTPSRRRLSRVLTVAGSVA